MAKTKSRKFHQIKIHHNRWLIWAIAYVIFVGIAMVGYLDISNINTDAESAQSNFQSAHSYTASSLGFSVRYPSNWSIEADSATSVTFLPTTGSNDSGVTVMVTVPSAEKSIRKTLKISGESQTQVDGTVAAKISNDLGQGHSETVVIVTHNSKLYVIRGSDNFVENLLVTFHFLPKQ